MHSNKNIKKKSIDNGIVEIWWSKWYLLQGRDIKLIVNQNFVPNCKPTMKKQVKMCS